MTERRPIYPCDHFGCERIAGDDGYCDEHRPLIEEEGDSTVRRNGPMIVGERCPWCGALVTNLDHERSHD